MDYLIIGALLIGSALFSGISLGLMSLNLAELRRKAKLGDHKAHAIYDVRKYGNTLLTSLLLGNVLVNSILSIYLGTLLSGLAATILSTFLIVVFGEIVPQAYFKHHAMRFGYHTMPFTKLILFLTYPIARPIAYVLDKALGAEAPTVYNKVEMMHIVAEQEDLEHSDIDQDEERIMHGALSFSDKTVADVMTPREKIYALTHNRKLDQETLEEIRENGFSRIPVYSDSLDRIIGIFYVVSLVGKEALALQTVESMTLREPHTVFADEKLDTVLRRFLRSKRHLRIVKDRVGKTVGVITLEDILEEVIKSEIEDERDEN